MGLKLSAIAAMFRVSSFGCLAVLSHLTISDTLRFRTPIADLGTAVSQSSLIIRSLHGPSDQGIFPQLILCDTGKVLDLEEHLFGIPQLLGIRSPIFILRFILYIKKQDSHLSMPLLLAGLSLPLFTNLQLLCFLFSSTKEQHNRSTNIFIKPISSHLTVHRYFLVISQSLVITHKAELNSYRNALLDRSYGTLRWFCLFARYTFLDA
jgi:hypothetical protein